MSDILITVITVGLVESEIINTVCPLSPLFELPSVESIIVTPDPTDQIKSLLPFSFFHVDPGLGVYDAMNEGLLHANGSYIWFLNAGDDSLVQPSDIQPLLDKIRLLTRSSEHTLPIILFVSNPFISHLPHSLNIFFFKLSMVSLGMPVSHQNILVPSVIHKHFSLMYSFCSDYNLLSSLIFRKKSPVIIHTIHQLAHLSSGGISDTNRISVFTERLHIMLSIFPFILIPVFYIFYVFRSTREYIASFAKKLISLLLQLFKFFCRSIFDFI